MSSEDQDQSDYFLISSNIRRKRQLDSSLQQGDQVLFYIRLLANLYDDMNILDIGCGDGCVAAAFARDNFHGCYYGFDINRAWIDAMNELFRKKRKSNFSFSYADIFHSYYNSAGTIAADKFVFNVPNEIFDLAIANSIFTHFKADAIRHYLSECHRVLKPRGRLWCTFFIQDKYVEKDKVRDMYRAKEKYGEGYTSMPENPEGCVLYDSEKVNSIITGAGFKIEKHHVGGWKKGVDQFNNESHDILVLSKVS